MPRGHSHGGDAYTTSLTVKVNPQALAVLDRLRGQMTRGAYIRQLIREEAKRENPRPVLR